VERQEELRIAVKIDWLIVRGVLLINEALKDWRRKQARYG
jgi:hypothetical protein